MLDACQKEIDSFYAKYASKEGISIAEAKKRVSKLDIASYERKAKKYVRDKDFSPKANEEMRLYNATMKINRLEMLKANIGLELIAGHEELEKFMGKILKDRTMDELVRQAGILGKTVKNNAAKAHAIVNGSFHNGTFSDRIWQYQDLMREDLGRLLQTGLIQGKNPRAIAKDLKKYWFGNDPRTGGGATYCMERLMRTELARVQTEAQKQSFQRNGFDMYEFICNEHASKHGTCDVCRGLNGKHFKVKDMMPGENAPPIHPRCRCSTAAWEDSKEYEAWLDHLAAGGTTKEWEKVKKTVENSGKNDNIGLYRKTGNTGAFAGLPERMSKKHIRDLAKEFDIDLRGMSLSIDANEDLLRIGLTGCANPDDIGNVIFFPNAFTSKEELVRTLFHEKVHVRQFREYGADYVQKHRAHFETLAYDEEAKFIDKVKKKGLL